MLERSSCLHRWQELGGRDRESRPLAGTQGECQEGSIRALWLVVMGMRQLGRAELGLLEHRQWITKGCSRVWCWVRVSRRGRWSGREECSQWCHREQARVRAQWWPAPVSRCHRQHCQHQQAISMTRSILVRSSILSSIYSSSIYSSIYSSSSILSSSSSSLW